MATHLILHALEHSPEGRFSLILEPVDLGSRMFGVMHVQAQPGRTRRVPALFGLAWLRQSVQEAGGLLELDQDVQGGLRPRIYLPTASSATATVSDRPLEGRHVWVVDQDPLAREAMTALIRLAGGQVQAYEGLLGLLRDSHGQRQPDVLVLERTPRLERFHRSLRAFQKEPIPTLVVGMGNPLPMNPGALGLRRLGFIEKPFRIGIFLESVMALLHQPQGTDQRLL
jgi:hypothetical protein